MKVLYVEDNDDDVYMLKTRLELVGDFEVLTARNGEKGCELALGERPDVIIMDLEMPVMGSAQERLRRDVMSLTPSRFSSSDCWKPYGVWAVPPVTDPRDF
jgi:CheY-like chemotaxis protein